MAHATHIAAVLEWSSMQLKEPTRLTVSVSGSGYDSKGNVIKDVTARHDLTEDEALALATKCLKFIEDRRRERETRSSRPARR